MSQERRRFERIKIRLSAGLDGAAPGPGVLAPTILVLDVSLGGAYCEVDRPLDPLTKVMLTLSLPGGEDSEQVTCRGVVVRTEPQLEAPEEGRYRIGILFTEISREDRDRLQRFLQGQLERQGD